MTYRLGITGGIGTGKSSVRADFEANGVATIDVDQIARQLLGAGQPLLEAVRKAFGPMMVSGDGELNRGALARVVFADPAKLAQLNEIVQPGIRAAFNAQLQAVPADTDIVACEVPLLYEQNYDSYFDAVVLADCDEQIQLQRVMSRDGLTAVAAQRRIDAQMDQSKKRERADFVIDTNGPEELRQVQVMQLISYLRNL
jgi:dephospho-CoA kinase